MDAAVGDTPVEAIATKLHDAATALGIISVGVEHFRAPVFRITSGNDDLVFGQGFGAFRFKVLTCTSSSGLRMILPECS
nr:hypothetical protein [Rhizobium sp. NXC24]